jgi:hypothetical protein
VSVTQSADSATRPFPSGQYVSMLHCCAAET